MKRSQCKKCNGLGLIHQDNAGWEMESSITNCDCYGLDDMLFVSGFMMLLVVCVTNWIVNGCPV